MKPPLTEFSDLDRRHMKLALRLARKGRGSTSPNPMVGAVLARGDRIIGTGWHRRVGEPHAEVAALRGAQANRAPLHGAVLYVTLEPCSTRGRTPPCTDAILQAGIPEVVVAAIDPNPAHRGRGIRRLQKAGLRVRTGLCREESEALNEPFNHWIVHHTPWVTVKSAMTLDGKIATVAGESKWITGPTARAYAMRLRRANDAILVGIGTVLADNPRLTVRSSGKESGAPPLAVPRRIILDSLARTPPSSNLVSDDFPHRTTIVVSPLAPLTRVRQLAKRVNVWTAPRRRRNIDLHWLLRRLGQEQVTSLLVEGGGETNAAFLLGRFAHRVVFFYAPIIVGGRTAAKGVAGPGARLPSEVLALKQVQWRRFGEDLCLSALTSNTGSR